MLTCVGIEAGGLTGVQSFDGDPVAKFERGKFLMQVDVTSFARGPVTSKTKFYKLPAAGPQLKAYHSETTKNATKI